MHNRSSKQRHAALRRTDRVRSLWSMREWSKHPGTDMLVIVRNGRVVSVSFEASRRPLDRRRIII
jgi:hypothetical protein